MWGKDQGRYPVITPSYMLRGDHHGWPPLSFNQSVSNHLRDDYIMQRDGGMQGVIQFIGLAHSWRSDRVHHLGYRVWIYRAARVPAWSSTHTEQERLTSRAEAACLFGTKAILASQRHCKAPT